jgi:hypothetical protein
MILSEIYKKVQYLDNQIKLLSELKSVPKKTEKKVFKENSINHKPQLIIEKVNKLENLVSQLNIQDI